MNTIILVYKTDNWHSYASRDIIGAVTTNAKAIAICKAQATKEGYKIDEGQLFNLESFKQTQGYEGEGEFMFEALQVDKLL